MKPIERTFGAAPWADSVEVDGKLVDRWVLGEASDRDALYLIHLAEPRFLCKYGIERQVVESLGRHFMRFRGQDGIVYWDFVFLGGDRPGTAALVALMAEADAAIARSAFKP